MAPRAPRWSRSAVARAARGPRKFTVADFNDDAAEPVQGGGFLAQLLAEVEFRVDERNLKAMGPDALAKIKQRMVAEGWAQIEAGKRYVRRTPLIGRVEVGKRKFFTDQKGFVQFRAMPPAKDLKDVPFFRQISDTRPFVVIPRLELAPAGQTPKPSLATLVTGLPP